MAGADDYMAMSDEELLKNCSVETYRSSGPGGQHRNKVSSAVRLRHISTGLAAHGDESRSQPSNKLMALHRLRMTLACSLRRPIAQTGPIPPFAAECMFTARGGLNKGKRRMQIGVKDHRFWRVGAFLLDVLEHFDGALSDSADWLGVPLNNFTGILKSERHLLTAAQRIRKDRSLPPIR